MKTLPLFVVLSLIPLVVLGAADLSIRTLPEISQRPKAGGPALFVDAAAGADTNQGTEQAPWKSVQHALSQLAPGDTLYLRGGVYYETVRCSLAGAPDRPVTIRAYPGERAILDGGYREFADSPATAWAPYAGGAPDEYRSVRPYRNITGVCGMFGDTRIGLHTYWLPGDLRAVNEIWHMDASKRIFDGSLYCGPGLWYDAATGYIHCRLAHTHNQNALAADYRGETDPRKLPLVIAPIEAVPLHLDHAQHLHVQDLLLRGGGTNTVLLEHCAHVDLNGVVAECGNLTGHHSGPVSIIHCAIQGRVPPWMWRIDSSQGCASGATRDIVRLVTPTLFETSHETEEPYALPRAYYNEIASDQPSTVRTGPLEGEDAKSPQMIHYPGNHDWEIAWSEFTDGHDGVFLVGRNMRFHHNLVENIQDDALDISAAHPHADDTMFVTQNVIRHVLTGISTHNYDVHWPRGKAFIARNIIDQRQRVLFQRASDQNPEGEATCVGTFLLHGSDHAQFVESVYFYQNTCIAPTQGEYAFAHRTMFHLKPGSERRVFNNIFVYLNDTGRYPPPLYGLSTKEADLQIDGNLHWNPRPGAQVPANYFDKLRASVLSEFNKGRYPAGFGANELAGDPRFVSFTAAGPDGNDFRLSDGSPATAKGLPLPAEWPDPLRSADNVRPDIGALPAGGEPLKVGIHGRVVMN